LLYFHIFIVFPCNKQGSFQCNLSNWRENEKNFDDCMGWWSLGAFYGSRICVHYLSSSVSRGLGAF
jgi:hypothetical protein